MWWFFELNNKKKKLFNPPLQQIIYVINLMYLKVEKAERALEYIKGYAKGYITDNECNEMMDIIQFKEYQS